MPRLTKISKYWVSCRPAASGVVERVEHADAFERCLLDPVDEGRVRQLRRFEDGRRDVDDVGELGPRLAPCGDPARPVHDHAVAGAAPVGGDLLGPLVRGVHGVRPADGVVVVGVRAAEVADPVLHELDGLQLAGAVERDGLVEGAVDRALGRGAVVADDEVDQGVVEQFQPGQRVDEPADVVVGVLEEPGVDLHLAGEHRLEVVGHVVPCGDLVRPRWSARRRPG